MKLKHFLMDEAESIAPSGAASSAAPEAPAAPAPDSNLAEGDAPAVDWSAVADDMLSEDAKGGDPTPGGPTPTEAQPPTPAQPASAPAPKPGEAEQPTPAVTPALAPSAPTPAAATPPVAPAVPAVAAPAVAAKTPEQLEAERQAADTEFKKTEETRFNGLVEYYKLPEDMAEKMQTEPEVVLPFLAAKLHTELARGLANTVHQLLPQAIQHVQQRDAIEAEARTAFNTRWPALADKQQQVLEVGALFRRVNPNATREEAIERIGQQVCIALGIPVTPGGTPSVGTTATPVTPPAPKPAVFTPAGGGGGPRGAAPAADNLFTAMADDFLLEDRGS